MSLGVALGPMGPLLPVFVLPCKQIVYINLAALFHCILREANDLVDHLVRERVFLNSIYFYV